MERDEMKEKKDVANAGYEKMSRIEILMDSLIHETIIVGICGSL